MKAKKPVSALFKPVKADFKDLFKALAKELRDANLTGADLTGANLIGANLEGAHLNGTNLVNVKMDEPVAEQIREFNAKQTRQ